MITVTKQENGVLFTFQDSDKYLYGSGTILVPFNSLSIIMDESDMITLRKSASNDIFLSARYDTDLGYGSKEEAVDALTDMLYDEAGISQKEVQDMIDAATSGIPSSEMIEQLRTDVNTLSGNTYSKSQIDGFLNTAEQVISTKADASALTEVRQDVNTLSGDVENKQDKLQFYGEDTEQWEESDGDTPDSTAVFTQKQSDILTYDSGDEGSSQAGVQTRVDTVKFNGVLDTGQSGSLVNIYANESSNETTEYGSSIEVSDNGVGIKSSFIDYDDESSQRLASINMNHNDVSISLESTANGDSTVMVINPSGVTINNERVLTEGDVDNALNSGSTNPVANSAITTAIDAKADKSALNDYYTKTEVYNKQEVDAAYGTAYQALTAHTANTTVHVSQAEKDAWNAKVDTSAITTAITSGSTDSEIPTAKAVYDATKSGGGGMDDDTQQLISTAFNDLNDRKADLTELSKYQKKGDYVKTSTLADYMTNDAFDEYATAKERIISGALNDLNDKFGGIRLVKISQADYDALTEKSENTLYIINNVI